MEQRCSVGSRCEGHPLVRYSCDAVSHTFVDTIIAIGKTEVCDLTTPNADGAVIAL